MRIVVAFCDLCMQFNFWIDVLQRTLINYTIWKIVQKALNLGPSYKGPSTHLGKSSAYMPILLNYLKVWISSIGLRNDRKKSIGGGGSQILKFYHIRKNKSSCSSRTRDLRVCRSRKHPFRHRDRHQAVAI